MADLVRGHLAELAVGGVGGLEHEEHRVADHAPAPRRDPVHRLVEAEHVGVAADHRQDVIAARRGLVDDLDRDVGVLLLHAADELGPLRVVAGELGHVDPVEPLTLDDTRTLAARIVRAGDHLTAPTVEHHRHRARLTQRRQVAQVVAGAREASAGERQHHQQCRTHRPTQALLHDRIDCRGRPGIRGATARPGCRSRSVARTNLHTAATMSRCRGATLHAVAGTSIHRERSRQRKLVRGWADLHDVLGGLDAPHRGRLVPHREVRGRERDARPSRCRPRRARPARTRGDPWARAGRSSPAPTRRAAPSRCRRGRRCWSARSSRSPCHLARSSSASSDDRVVVERRVAEPEAERERRACVPAGRASDSRGGSRTSTASEMLSNGGRSASRARPRQRQLARRVRRRRTACRRSRSPPCFPGVPRHQHGGDVVRARASSRGRCARGSPRSSASSAAIDGDERVLVARQDERRAVAEGDLPLALVVGGEPDDHDGDVRGRHRRLFGRRRADRRRDRVIVAAPAAARMPLERRHPRVGLTSLLPSVAHVRDVSQRAGDDDLAEAARSSGSAPSRSSGARCLAARPRARARVLRGLDHGRVHRRRFGVEREAELGAQHARARPRRASLRRRLRCRPRSPAGRRRGPRWHLDVEPGARRRRRAARPEDQSDSRTREAPVALQDVAQQVGFSAQYRPFTGL